MHYSLTIEPIHAGQRADVAIAALLGITRSQVKSRLKGEGIFINSRQKPLSHICSENDKVELELKETEAPGLKPKDIPLDILYQDEHLLIINKQPGLVVHAGGGTGEDTLVNAILFHTGEMKDFEGSLRPGIVHRIDRDTSGLILVARNAKTLEALQSQFSERLIEKEYRAVVVSNIKEDTLVIDNAIGRHPVDRKKMAVTEAHSRNAVTQIQVLERFGHFTYVAAFPKTGRTHQIRVHMAYIKHPILGDRVYGSRQINDSLAGLAPRQMLHAFGIRFRHPETGELMELKAPLPKDMNLLLERLREKKTLFPR